MVGVALALLPASASAAPAVTGEFPLRARLEPNNNLVEGPDGNIWVTLTSKHEGEPDVARVNARTGEVSEFDLPGVGGAFGIASAGEKLWLTQDGGEVGPPGVTSFLASAPAATRQIKPIEEIGPACPIVAAPDGSLWVVAPGSLIRIENQILTVEIFPLPVLGPDDLDVAGSLLVMDDAFFGRIVTATIENPPKIAEFSVAGVPQGVAVAPSGLIAFSRPFDNLGLLAPPGTPRLIPAPSTGPFGVVLGSDGAFWFAQSLIDTVSRLTASGQVSTVAPGFARDSAPLQIATGPGNTLWVTLLGANRIGRISGVGSSEPPPGPPAPAAEPRTKIDQGPRSPVRARGGKATVRFRFSSPDAGSSFQCRLVRLAVGRGGVSKAPSFRACKSPKTFTVRPGRYRFDARAVRGGLADGSPATRAFRVVRVSAGRG
jgi:streptogramin lyase